MKKYKIEILDSAIYEIEKITEFIAFDSTPNAIKWHNNIKEKIGSLETFPERCQLADETSYFKFDLRCLLVNGYRVLYRINGGTVQILHVKNSRMNR